uniref:Uncharacterized protein n=1 Tax=Cannabis sativa TaxID=3483 RepID=A0A803Q9F3_CANSA
MGAAGISRAWKCACESTAGVYRGKVDVKSGKEEFYRGLSQAATVPPSASDLHYNQEFREKEKEQRIYKSNGRRMADTLTAFETLIKYNPSGLTPGVDPNRKTLDKLRASKIKKAAGPSILHNPLTGSKVALLTPLNILRPSTDSLQLHWCSQPKIFSQEKSARAIAVWIEVNKADLIKFVLSDSRSERAQIHRRMSSAASPPHFFFLRARSTCATRAIGALLSSYSSLDRSDGLRRSFPTKIEKADKAATKAMPINRVGDFGLALGISGRFTLFQIVDFSTIFSRASAPRNSWISCNMRLNAITLMPINYYFT